MPERVPRRLLLRVVAKLLGLCTVCFFAVVLLDGMLPSFQSRSDALVVPLGRLKTDQVMRVTWQGRRILILRRSAAALASLRDLDPVLADPDSAHSEQPPEARNSFRSAAADYFVALDYDPEFGCPLAFIDGAKTAPVAPWLGGFRAPCSDSWFDPAGRVYRQQRTTRNLRVPPHHLEAGRLVLGE